MVLLRDRFTAGSVEVRTIKNDFVSLSNLSLSKISTSTHSMFTAALKTSVCAGDVKSSPSNLKIQVHLLLISYT